MFWNLANVLSVALLQLPTGVRGASGAFVNFSAATAAAAFIGAQNRTFISELGCRFRWVWGTVWGAKNAWRNSFAARPLLRNEPEPSRSPMRLRKLVDKR
jgi:hypothetical protein